MTYLKASVSVLAMILAGGRGERLSPLTDVRAKPAVQFGGKYRIIDFVLNNMINSRIYKIKVLTQFKSNSLIKHLSDAWHLNRMVGHYIDVVPAQMRTGDIWYQGTADAIYQNINLLYEENADYIAIFGGDHIYKMDVRQMLEFHLSQGADLTVSAIPFPREKASSFGILEVDSESRILAFHEKPAEPVPMPSNPSMALASMGNYIFGRDILIDVLCEDARRDTSHDFGKDIVPSMVREGYRVLAYDFSTNEVPGTTEQERGYWRDVGTIEAYYEANMDLRTVSPIFNLYNRQWPLRTAQCYSPPAKFVFAGEGDPRRGEAIDSLISEGCVISGSRVRNSVLSPDVFVHSFAEVNDSILMSGVDIGRGAKIRRAIIDKYHKIPGGEIIGYDSEEDRKKYFVSESGIVVIAKKELAEHSRLAPTESRDSTRIRI
ncbi:MAG TPA: glucose-1-phosphate adenylyltransferase [Firmicutes bacterium]|nr:glucose-1-phosphate adenylyltransferase [Bacillota bacterium]